MRTIYICNAHHVEQCPECLKAAESVVAHRPSREVLAREYAITKHRDVPVVSLNPDKRDGFLAGFDAGFARAVSMLRAEKDLESHRAYGQSHLHWADWLLEQQSKECGE